ncbi:protein-tyrosine phosphatase-like protein [Dipodascopsis uninucleata]
MAEFLRSAIASPRARHYDPVADTYLDLAYLEHNIIVCSMPTNEFPKIMYRNSLADLRKLLNTKHGDNWRIWEFRAEGTGYDDEEVYNRVCHFPFPDHNPPPFALIPQVVSSINAFLSKNPDNVAVLHCKAGKGRSGTMFCAYLIAQHKWSAQNALAHFTARRMRSGFGEGVSILSQRRYINYVERWANDPQRKYRDLGVLIKEVRIWNPVRGIEVRCCGFKNLGQKIVTLYTFAEDDLVSQKMYPKTEKNQLSRAISERSNGNSSDSAVGDSDNGSNGQATDYEVQNTANNSKLKQIISSQADQTTYNNTTVDSIERRDGDHLCRTGTFRSIQYHRYQSLNHNQKPKMTGKEITLQPKGDVYVDADINITIEKKVYGPAGLSFLSATSYVWFNAFFEGDIQTGGTFSIAWEEMDGFKGTKKRGGKIFDRLEVDWVVAGPSFKEI